MTIMRGLDRAKAKEHGLEICEACGWTTDRFGHESRCRPDAGRLADAIAAEAMELHPTKMGYGTGYLTFEIREGLHVRFEFRGNPPEACLADVHALGDVSAPLLARLIALAYLPRRNESSL